MAKGVRLDADSPPDGRTVTRKLHLGILSRGTSVDPLTSHHGERARWADGCIRRWPHTCDRMRGYTRPTRVHGDPQHDAGNDDELAMRARTPVRDAAG